MNTSSVECTYGGSGGAPTSAVYHNGSRRCISPGSGIARPPSIRSTSARFSGAPSMPTMNKADVAITDFLRYLQVGANNLADLPLTKRDGGQLSKSLFLPSCEGDFAKKANAFSSPLMSE